MINRSWSFSKIAEVIARILLLWCLILFLTRLAPLRKQVEENSLISSIGDDDASSCSIEFDISEEASPYLLIPSSIIKFFIILEVLLLILGTPYAVCNTCTHRYRLVGDVIIFVTFLALLFISNVAYQYSFPITPYDGVTLYFNVETLSRTASILGCSFDISAIKAIMVSAILIVFAANFVCIVVWSNVLLESTERSPTLLNNIFNPVNSTTISSLSTGIRPNTKMIRSEVTAAYKPLDQVPHQQL